MLRFDRRLLLNVDWLLVAAAGFIVALSVLSLWSLAPGRGGGVLAWRQLSWVGVGLVAMLIMVGLDYRRLVRAAPAFYVMGVALLLTVFILGRTVSGARRWDPPRPDHISAIGALQDRLRAGAGLGADHVADAVVLAGRRARDVRHPGGAVRPRRPAAGSGNRARARSRRHRHPRRHRRAPARPRRARLRGSVRAAAVLARAQAVSAGSTARLSGPISGPARDGLQRDSGEDCHWFRAALRERSERRDAEPPRLSPRAPYRLHLCRIRRDVGVHRLPRAGRGVRTPGAPGVRDRRQRTGSAGADSRPRGDRGLRHPNPGQPGDGDGPPARRGDSPAADELRRNPPWWCR